MINLFIQWLKRLFGFTSLENYNMDDTTRELLHEKVEFYRGLNTPDKQLFEQRILMFIDNTSIIGRGVELTLEDCLLIASSAIIPVWAFPNWHYFNLRKVILVPAAFNEQRQFGQPDSNITGMVGTGFMAGKMLLSKPALHYGFLNSVDKKNVGIHEFAHLIDMADGSCDGFPERLSQYAIFAPWMHFVENKIEQIKN
ncbi:MAG: zinc-dependent peptidase, partial [Psychromonas sp.]|nr:zinc-dependent peptidase [Psychromonas sp.]